MSAAIDAFFDILSATLGAASGALITALANRQKNKSLNDQIVISSRELDKVRLENDRLLKLIEKRENQILELEQKRAKRKPPFAKATRSKTQTTLRQGFV